MAGHEINGADTTGNNAEGLGTLYSNNAGMPPSHIIMTKLAFFPCPCFSAAFEALYSYRTGNSASDNLGSRGATFVAPHRFHPYRNGRTGPAPCSDKTEDTGDTCKIARH